MSQDTNQLDGKVALVMGASRGIGAEIARAYAAAGAGVVLAARDVAGTTVVIDAGKMAGTPTFSAKAREMAA
jgi:NAD(P)-dependent dehydrogenase (short-subunit alcohol dehydrogenase family)